VVFNVPLIDIAQQNGGIKMKKYVLEVSQNVWEYTGFVYIECNELKRDSKNKKNRLC
jgi:hypothetical protein